MSISWASHYYPCVRGERHLVVLHGWGGDSRLLAPLCQRLSERFHVTCIDLPGHGQNCHTALPDWRDLIAQLAEQLPSGCLLMGWSLGGMIAQALSAEYPQRVAGLISLAASPSFVARADWPALETDTLTQFRQQFATDPQRTWQRFMRLQSQGASREVQQQLRRWQAEASSDWASLALGLDWLAQLDLRDSFANLAVPGLHLLGAGDPLVPESLLAAMQRLNPQQTSVLLESAGHLPFLTQLDGCVERIFDWVPAPELDKQRIAASFGRSAASYDKVAQLQRDVGHELMSHLPDLPEDACILDLGCGTGYFTPQLQQTYANADVLALDLSHGMLTYAREQRGGVGWLCGDAELLPIADESLDCLFSSLAIQWCDNLEAVMREALRVLKPGGYFVFSTLGPDTLWELRRAWQSVDQHVHVNRFMPLDDVRSAFASCALQSNHLQVQQQVLLYQQVRELAFELKALGAHNVNRDAPAGLTGRAKLRALEQGYEGLRNRDGLLPATYQVFYGRLQKAN